MAGHAAVGLHRVINATARVIIPVIFITVTVVFLRALSVESPSNVSGQCVDDGSSPHYIPMTTDALQRFSHVLQIATVSYDVGDQRKPDERNLLALQRLLQTSFPVIHNSSLVTLEVINEFSLLYTVRGSDDKLKPYMLAAHLDVVPANAENWDHPPFGGVIDAGFIYGRGAMDNKHNLMGILEALEHLLKGGFQPRRSIYLTFGHDEEVMGNQGAQEMARVLISRKVELQFVLDEGLFIANNTIKFIDYPVAMIGVAEKGYSTLKLTVKSNPGHSSAPPTNTVIGILAKAVARLEENPHRNMFGTGVEVSMLEQLSSYAPFYMKLVLSNLWLFSPIVSRVMAMDRHQNTFLRTTTALTMFNGGVKSNVLPNEAVAFVNHRIHQLQSAAEILKRDEEIIDDHRVNVEAVTMMEPSPVSPFSKDTFGFQLIKETVRQIHSNVVVVPASVMGSTDCKWYVPLTKEIYRFSAIILEKDDFDRYHGNNERISVRNYEKTINFYHHLILNAEMDLQTLLSNRKDEL